MGKFKVGDRVKYTGNSLHSRYVSTVTKVRSLDYVLQIEPNGKYDADAGDGWDGRWYCSGDTLELIKEGTQVETMSEKRTFKLLVDTPGLRKGALLQEDYIGGSSPYYLLDDEFSKDSSYKVKFAKRELVEDAPKFFQEVFKVHPEYMTRAELDKWEAFKKGKTAKAEGKPTKKKKAPVKYDTPQTRRVAQLVSIGHSNGEIAQIMRISLKAVSTYKWSAKKAGLL